MSLIKGRKNPNSIVLIIIACLYIPLIESMHGAPLWGLNWHSPLIMEQTREVLRLVKLTLVILALVLFFKHINEVKVAIPNRVLRVVFVISSFCFASLQIILLFLAILFDSTSSSQWNYFHKEKHFDKYSIYIHTVDPGAVGKAYHNFYVKCPRPLKRYELRLVNSKEIDWMRDYSIDVKEGRLIINENDDTGNVYRFDISHLNCSSRV